eukprot:scaffold2621_cov164-Ochromonas_danica.AAC.1
MFSSPFHSMKYSKVAVDNNDCNPIHQDGKSCKVTRKLSDHGISGATLSKTLYQNEEIIESKLSYADDNNKVNNLHATTGFEPLPSARSKVENGIIDDDSDDDTIGPLPYYRSWAKYAGDSRSIVHHSFFSFCINFAFAAVSYAVLHGKGHLKLADFGLSKIVGAPQSVDTSSTNGLSTLGINEDVHAQLQKYLPPKAYLAGRDVPKKVFIVPILQILCGRDKSKSSRGRDTSFVTAEKIFGEESNLRIDVTTVKDRLFAVTLLHDKNIEAVFIDGGKGRLETQDLVDTVHYICTTLRSHIPIYVVNALSDVALQVIEAGAKECFEEMLDELDEVTYRRLFNIHYEPSQPPREGPIEPNHSLNPSNSTSTTTMLRSDLPRAGGEEEHSVVGTIHYIAPEVIHEHRYGEPVDWWALGISIYICIVRQHVFQGEGPAEVRDKIVGSDPDLLPLKAFDESAYDLVTKLLQKNPENRIGTIEGAMALREHPYFQGIDWTALPTMDMPLKPAEFKLGKYDLKEKLLFYGEPLIRDKIHMSMQELDERNSSSITRHKLNMQRVRRVVKNKHPLPSSSRYSQGKILGLSQGHSFLSTLDQSRDMETSDSGVVFTVPEEDENDEDREDINEPTGEQNVPIEARVRSFSDFASGTSCMMESM